jgi:outer membrane murein-binding lipoprotein Lpp
MEGKSLKHAAIFLAFLIVVTGCARNKGLQKDVNLLKTQVGGVAADVGRLTEEQKALQEALQNEEARASQLEQEIAVIRDKIGAYRSGSMATSKPGVYRTPSGFEVDSREIQSALKNAGYYTGLIDGKIEFKSVGAIKEFQTDNNLEVDGICGRKTWAKLRPYLESQGR